MPSFDIAKEANPALVLPALLLSIYVERSGLLLKADKTFHEGETVFGESCIRLTLDDGKALADQAIVSYLAGLAPNREDSEATSLNRSWVRRTENFTIGEFQALRQPMQELNHHLASSPFIAGTSLSTADLAVWGALRGNRVAQSLIRKSKDNVSRWYAAVEASNAWISEDVAEFLAHKIQKKAIASSAGASYEIDLPIMKGPTVTRFPPEPSGYLHIGHAKAALLNDYFAHKNNGGTLICRFDDTNPSKESMEFQDAILYDLKLMEIVPDRISHSSDYFQVMYEYAVKLIKDGKAFADDSELGKGGEDRKNRLPSKRRDLSIEETLARLEDMKTGSAEGLRWCIRARIAYDSPNGTLRDPVIYRCNILPHHRTGTTWKIYPTYDFCAPLLDSIEGVTLALRTNEYRDRNAQYEWMQKALGLREVPIWDFSRINFTHTVLSKRKLTRIVNDGKVWGWDDPRMPTIRGILRRGMTVPALREFILKQGPSKNVLNLEWGAIWVMNKKFIDPVAPRHTAIIQENAVRCHIQGFNGEETALKPRYQKNASLGTKEVIYSDTILLSQADAQSLVQAEEVTLMNWGNAYVRSITKDPADRIITGLDLELHLSGDVKKTKKITWLADVSRNLVSVDLVTFDHLITKNKLEKEDELEKFLATVTETRQEALADCNVTELSRGAKIQFERLGYYTVDVPYAGDGSRMVFFDIPSGKA